MSSRSSISLPPWPPLNSPTHILFWNYHGFPFESVWLPSGLARGSSDSPTPSCFFLLHDAPGLPTPTPRPAPPPGDTLVGVVIGLWSHQWPWCKSQSHPFFHGPHQTLRPLGSFSTNFSDCYFHRLPLRTWHCARSLMEASPFHHSLYSAICYTSIITAEHDFCPSLGRTSGSAWLCHA